MDDRKKLMEMEESIKAIAKFVREQTTKLEEQIGSKGGNDVEYMKDEMEELKRRIESFGDEKEFSRLQFKKLDKLEENLDERMSKLEESARQKGDDKLKKTLQDTRADLDSLRRDMMSKVKFMEQKVDKVNQPELHLEELNGSVERLEREMNELRSKRAPAEDYRKELDRASSEIMGKVKSKMSEQEKMLNDMSSRIKNFDSNTQLEQLRQDIYSKINKIQSSPQPHDDDWKAGIAEKVEMIDRKLNETLVAKNHLSDLERNLSEMRATLGKVKNFNAGGYGNEFEAHVSRELDKLHGIETSDIKKLNEMVEKFRGIEAEDIKRLSESLERGVDDIEDERVTRMSTEKRLHDLEAKIASHDKHIEESLSSLRNLEIDDLKKLSKSLEQKKGYDLGEIKQLAEQLVKEREEMEKEVVNRMSLERKVNEMEQKMRNISMAAEDVEDLDIDRVSLERRVQLIDQKLRDMQGSLQKLGNLENLDMPKLAGRLQDMESNMKVQTIKILTQQLNEFAKSVDRRLPSIVSREEYMRQITDINQRMRTIEAPDLSPLGARVSRLEKTIEEVASMMRSMYNRVPIVVE